MNGCETMLEDLTGYVHGELDARATSSLETHLRECAGCHLELGRLRKLEELLRVHLPRITPSPTFASTFANRLAAEIEAEDARREKPSIFGWLTHPWMIPAGALAVLVLAVAYALAPSGPGGIAELAAPMVSGPKSEVVKRLQAPQPARVADKRDPGKSPALAATGKEPGVPPELMREADPFIDYAIIRQLKILETNGSGGSERAG